MRISISSALALHIWVASCSILRRRISLQVLSLFFVGGISPLGDNILVLSWEARSMYSAVYIFFALTSLAIFSEKTWKRHLSHDNCIPSPSLNRLNQLLKSLTPVARALKLVLVHAETQKPLVDTSDSRTGISCLC